MTFQPNQNTYLVANGTSDGNGPQYPHLDVRAPTVYDVLYSIGTNWIWPGNGVWQLNALFMQNNVLTATWLQLATGTGDVTSIIGTTNQITASSPTGAVTLSIPSTFVAPGTITSTGNITTTAGNFVASGAGTGLMLTPTVVAAGASPQTVNGRVGQVTFSGVSMASGAVQTFVIDNTAITGAGTVILYGWYGATAGSAISMSSVVNAAGTSTIIMTNGTSATMVTDVANITFVFEVLN
jgi:trimeric autotransporter adhesin